MILLVDNYDSFSYNLYQLAGSINPDMKVIRNDEMTVDEIESLATKSAHWHRHPSSYLPDRAVRSRQADAWRL